MDVNQFISTLSNLEPPSGNNLVLQSLWWDAKGDWKKAHDIAQEIHDKDGSWIHAYLHRKEGDIWNADYWYRLADKKRPNLSLQDEWKEIVNYFLK